MQRVEVGAAAEHDSDMGLTLGDLYTSGLLLLNAIAVLHEERFLAKPIVSVSAFYFYVQRRESILSATASSIHMCMPPCPHASIQCSIR